MKYLGLRGVTVVGVCAAWGVVAACSALVAPDQARLWDSGTHFVGDCDGGMCAPPPDTGTCTTGSCAPPACGDGRIDPGETCDDGNTIDGDGCDAGCTFACASDAECGTGDICTGLRACDPARHVCVSSPVAMCVAPDACHTAACTPETGCVVHAIDMDGDGFAVHMAECGDDCNDADNAIHPGAMEVCDGADNDCNGLTDEAGLSLCYRDLDGDGYGGLVSMPGCECPEGWSHMSGDCADEGRAASIIHPMQTMCFGEPYCFGSPGGSCSFDYDCSGVEERCDTRRSDGCAWREGVCVGDGWAGGVPNCGQTSQYWGCTGHDLSSCASTTRTERVQTCH